MWSKADHALIIRSPIRGEEPEMVLKYRAKRQVVRLSRSNSAFRKTMLTLVAFFVAAQVFDHKQMGIEALNLAVMIVCLVVAVAVAANWLRIGRRGGYRRHAT